MNIIYKYKSSIQNLGVYFLASLIPMVISLLINPLVALNMDPDDYAIVGYYNSFYSLLFPFITFYVFSFYTKRFFELEGEDFLNLRATITQSLVYLAILLSVVSLGVLFIYVHYFNKESSIAFFPYAYLSVLGIPLTGLYNLKLIDYKMQKNSKSFFTLSMSNSIVSVILIVILVIIFKYGALGRMIAAFGASLTLFIWCIIKDFPLFKIKFDWSVFKSMIKFVWPLSIAAMLNFFSTGYDRVFLERFGNVNELGYYVVAIQVVGYIAVFRNAISNTFQPDLYEAVVKRNWKRAIKFIALNLGTTLIVVVVFIILAPFVIDLLTAGRYIYSAKYARILALSQLSITLFYVFSEITVIIGLTKIPLINKTVGSMIIIFMFSLFISKWQFEGAAWGNVISYLILTALNIILLFIWKRRRFLEEIRYFMKFN